MKWDAFVGPSYLAASKNINGERLVNLMIEMVESGDGKGPRSFLGRPGLQVGWTLPTDRPVRGLFHLDGRVFCVAGQTFFELLAGGGVINRGMLNAAGTLAAMASNGTAGHQVFIVSGGGGYIFDLIANTLTLISTAAFPSDAATCTFIDGYFLVLLSNSNQFQLSDLEDGTKWSGLDVAQRESTPDRVTTMIADHRELWLFGTEATEIWVDTGAADFPFAPLPGTLIEQGAFPYTPAKVDNTLIWVGRNKLGAGMAWRAEGYKPSRISTHGVEAQWALYPTLDDAEGYSYEEAGHQFYIVNFPTAGHSWAYDASIPNNMGWAERDWFNPQTGLYEAQLARCHCYAFGQHLVGDRTAGIVYTQSRAYLTDNGAPIRKRRRAPHLSDESNETSFDRLQIDCQVGRGVFGNTGQAPQATLRWSDDGGETWSNDHISTMGAVGQYLARVYWEQMGSGRDRVFELEIDDAVDVAISSAYLSVRQGAW